MIISKRPQRNLPREVLEGTTMVLNRADECLQRADECRHSAAQSADDVLRVTFLDLSRRWRMMAREAEALEPIYGN